MITKAHEGGPEIMEHEQPSPCSFCNTIDERIPIARVRGVAICSACVSSVRRQMNATTQREQPGRHIGPVPESVALVACGATSTIWHNSSFTYERQTPKPDQVWALNKGLRTIRADLGFVLDDMVGEARRSEEYYEDLRELRIPIITSVLDDDVRALYPELNLIPFPLQAILWRAGVYVAVQRGLTNRQMAEDPATVWRLAQGIGNYFHNSVPMIIAYAWYIGVKRLYLYGADYTWPGQTAREDDRANCEYWVGGMRFAGMHIVVPNETTLLNQRFQPRLYGYNARPPVLRAPTPAEIQQQLLDLGMFV